MSQTEGQVKELIRESIGVKSAMLADAVQLELIQRIAASIIEALKRGKKVIFCGNGGSFADSIHLAGEFVPRFQKEHVPLAAIALGANTSILTAIGNDYSYAEVFSRELAAIGQAGDVLIAISTSGNSENIHRAVRVAQEIGIHVYGMTGQGGGRLAAVTESLKVPSQKTARIQESHILVGHIICELVENAMVGA
ncbi:SIS domain-containing protein [Candidatus Methylomirabilis sp.]|uniref:D-sedoheptulose-7-phosphate isomerase n=1 Tax=Candidatus Methylomirabilis sp. TaxID=2032687 RepID=UPI002A624DDA|nr:SIS domain-containing protein [Candidatus Methylomirabilis sp.]